MKEGPHAERSVQRLSEDALNDWLSWEYGMFIHYGMNTYSKGRGGDADLYQPIENYRPTALDVDQWVAVARDAGMKYAILTTKHGTGFCLWPTKHSDYNVANSPCKVDVVEAFVNACRKYGVKPAFYHCGGDHNFGLTGGEVVKGRKYEHLEYVTEHVKELLTWYGPIAEMWFDGPGQYGLEGRKRLYSLVTGLQPQIVVANNGAFDNNGHKSVVKPETWPTDVNVIEAGVPPFWPIDRFDIGEDVTGKPGPAEEYFLPIEVVTCMDNMADRWWFGGDHAVVRSQNELLAIRLLCKLRGANCVLNVPPTPEGRLRQDYIDALVELPKTWAKVAS